MTDVTARAETKICASVEEMIGLRRVAGLPAAEIVDVRHTSRLWRIFNIGFSITVPTSWCGDMYYRRRQVSVSPGSVFCAMPGEVHVTLRVHDPGSFNVLNLQPSLVREHLREQDQTGVSPEWRTSVDLISPRLRLRFANLLRVVEPTYSEMEQQTALSELVGLAAEELMRYSARRVWSQVEVAHTAESVRECLHGEGARMGLEALARTLNMSRFQLIRAFRRRYGLPPHAYQSCVRIGLARRMLLDGLSVTQASAGCGFADPSHFGRHFKRALGISPKQYANTGGGRSSGRGRTCAANGDWLAAALANSDTLACPDFRAAFGLRKV